MKMSEEEQIERMKKNQARLTNKKKPRLPTPGSQTQTQSQSSETQEEVWQILKYYWLNDCYYVLYQYTYTYCTCLI